MSRRAMKTPAAPKPPRAAAPLAPAPPAWRDPWLWLSALSVLPLLFHSLGAPLGEPVAEDFDFLRHNLVLGRHGLLDGGGSQAFWRPVPHQLYYRLLGGWILDHPRWVAALHLALLALSAALIYRIARRWWSGPLAAVAASFPFLAESTRTVISWPSHGVELASLLFAVLAVHEASRRRLATCLVALAPALLSKELAIAAAILIPLLPGEPGEDLRASLPRRARWAAATGVLTLVWALLYLWVRRHAGLALPHQLESDAATLAVPLPQRFAWAAWNSLRAAISLPAAAEPGEMRWLGGAAAILAAALLLLPLTRGSRARAAAALPWIGWGLAWFALSSAALTTIFPIWAPNRALFGSVGLGLALAALAGAAHPLLPWTLVALRLVTFAQSPGPSRDITVEGTATGAFMDFAQLTRLQRLMADTRGALAARFPTLPRGAQVGQHSMPRRAEYAFGGDHALQCWYRDTTLRWVRYSSYSADSTIPLATIAEYQLGYVPAVALVEPVAMRRLLDGVRLISEDDLVHGLAALTLAESLQKDRGARIFLGTVVGKRAVCEMGLGDRAAAVAEAERSIALYREGLDGRYVIALLALDRGDVAVAAAQVDTLLFLEPGDPDAIALRDRIVARGR